MTYYWDGFEPVAEHLSTRKTGNPILWMDSTSKDEAVRVVESWKTEMYQYGKEALRRRRAER